ncbi:response regulator transcription factor [Nonomuraea aridisoli]|uniref:response regulator transcription factor n=1 Tax=Nonomuraea aridisoli TaxID=2070368 RepID=UPI001C64A525|nr:helix-turn-helix transcriptional regulator [Nonomuraea aridisoli]
MPRATTISPGQRHARPRAPPIPPWGPRGVTPLGRRFRWVRASEGGRVSRGRPARPTSPYASAPSRDWRPIGARLGVAETTVKTHLAHVFAKLGMRDRVQAVGAGLRERVGPPSV